MKFRKNFMFRNDDFYWPRSGYCIFVLVTLILSAIYQAIFVMIFVDISCIVAFFALLAYSKHVTKEQRISLKNARKAPAGYWEKRRASERRKKTLVIVLFAVALALTVLLAIIQSVKLSKQ